MKIAKYLAYMIIFGIVIPAVHFTLSVFSIARMEVINKKDICWCWYYVNKITAFPIFYTKLANSEVADISGLLLINSIIFSLCGCLVYLGLVRLLKKG